MLNYIKRIKHKLISPVDLKAPPLRVDIEVCNICNYNCLVCTTGNGRINRPRQFLTIQGLQEILTKLETADVKQINVNCIGEPFLNPEIYGIIGFLDTIGKETSLPTNASVIKPERLRNFTRLHLKVSLDSTRYESYRAYRRTSRANYERAIANIRLLADIGIPFELSTLVTRYNQDHLDEIQAFADGLGVKVSFKPIICSPFGVTQQMLPKGVTLEDNWVGRKYVHSEDHAALAATGEAAELYSKYQWDEALGLYCNPHELKACPFIHTTWICADGMVLPCCFEAYYSTVEFGNIFEAESFGDIWLSQKYLAFRREMLKPAQSSHGPCRICTKS